MNIFTYRKVSDGSLVKIEVANTVFANVVAAIVATGIAENQVVGGFNPQTSSISLKTPCCQYATTQYVDDTFVKKVV